MGSWNRGKSAISWIFPLIDALVSKKGRWGHGVKNKKNPLEAFPDSRDDRPVDCVSFENCLNEKTLGAHQEPWDFTFRFNVKEGLSYFTTRNESQMRTYTLIRTTKAGTKCLLLVWSLKKHEEARGERSLSSTLYHRPQNIHTHTHPKHTHVGELTPN